MVHVINHHFALLMFFFFAKVKGHPISKCWNFVVKTNLISAYWNLWTMFRSARFGFFSVISDQLQISPRSLSWENSLQYYFHIRCTVDQFRNKIFIREKKNGICTQWWRVIPNKYLCFQRTGLVYIHVHLMLWNLYFRHSWQWCDLTMAL